MPVALASLKDLGALPFDQLIDARSPSEFAEDHIPGAINLPSLNDSERAEVGTIYVQVSRFDARKIGAAMVARNIAMHLEGALKEMDGAWRPLVYCWRGGQRSGAFASYLKQIGWRADTLDGGYKTYRRLVNAVCHRHPFPGPVVLLDGNTGTAKTELLTRLAERGVQVLDLEGAANHRGSAFGARAGGQPSQKMFEGRLAEAMAGFDPHKPVVIEAESSKVGACIVPPSVWAAMRKAPRISLSVPVAARTEYLVEAYDDLWENPEGLAQGIQALKPLQKSETIERWQRFVAEANHPAFVRELIELHYDPRYGRKREAQANKVLHSDRLDNPSLDRLADRIDQSLSEMIRPANG